MASLWHPFAEMNKVQHNPFIVDRGEGIYVYDEEGNRYLDAAASLWYMNVGYGRDEIIDRTSRIHPVTRFLQVALADRNPTDRP